jgi:hypothetical protein
MNLDGISTQYADTLNKSKLLREQLNIFSMSRVIKHESRRDTTEEHCG